MKRSSWWLGFDLCRQKIDRFGSLFIGVLVPNRRRQRSSQLPSSNPTLSCEDLEENQTGRIQFLDPAMNSILA
jgi:hypothetical protein